jgi:hypothetical protein
MPISVFFHAKIPGRLARTGRTGCRRIATNLFMLFQQVA